LAITLSFAKHRPEDGQLRLKHVAAVSYICKTAVVLLLFLCWDKCSELHRFDSPQHRRYIFYTKEPAIHVNKIYGNTGHTALWSTCKYRLIQHPVPVNFTVLYVATRIFCAKSSAVCVSRNEISLKSTDFIYK